MRSFLLDAALHLAWQQWTALGVAGSVSAPDHAIDLEALIGFTPVLGDDDPRLRDEALDWCVCHSQRVVSVTRLRHVRDGLSERGRATFDDFAADVNATAKLKNRWPTARTGTSRKTSGKSRAPELAEPSLLQLRLRAVFGVSARAELLLQLLRPIMTRETLAGMRMSTSVLTDTGYTKPTLSDVLADLTAAGVVEKWRRENRDYYALSRVEALTGLVGGVLPATAPTWSSRFRVAEALLAVDSNTAGKKEVVHAVAASTAFERLHDTLQRADLKPPASFDRETVARWAARELFADARTDAHRHARGART